MDIRMAVWLLPSVAAIAVLFISSSTARLWRWRRLWGELSAALTLVGFVFSLVSQLDWLTTVVIGFLNLVALLLAARLLFGRLPEEFLHYSTRSNALGLAVGFVAALLVGNLAVAALPFLMLLAGVGISLVVAIIFLYGAVWTLRHFRLRKLNEGLLSDAMPTVSLAIPARNETIVLTECLAAAVASDYPKLEILALDDCSQDKTSDLIRAFAHDGVRFIQGDQPDDGWLGKNQACKTLAAQASGDYILFSGVDTRLAPQSISKLVLYAVSNQLDMVAVLPRR
ncbi:MAG TPA: glycosyltransferase, partial [Candidatus Acidoferrum sp.]|nr:glycosyltransferase [Candidatus Acidoferrum sp.]